MKQNYPANLSFFLVNRETYSSHYLNNTSFVRNAFEFNLLHF